MTLSDKCSLCDAPMAEDQEWCLECGAARTTIRSPPDWRLAVVIVAAVAVLVLGGFGIALRRLTLTTRPPTRTGATAAHAPLTPPGPGGFRAWPPGLDGWTVTLGSATGEQAAISYATQLTKAGLSGLGVLSTTEHPRLRPLNAWYVFSGRYPTAAEANAAAAALAKKGQASATAVEVQRPGGI